MKWLTFALLLVAAVLAGLLVYRQFAPHPLLGGTALDTPLKVPALTLQDDQGRQTTLAAGDGRLRVTFFGYVHCPDVCPATLASLKNTYAGLTPQQQKQVQVQFITVDPANDTPQLIRQYLNRFDPAFTGLTGKSDTIDEAARALFVANVAPHNDPQASAVHHHAPEAADPADENVSAAEAGRIHGDEVRIITSAGDFVRVYTNQEALDGTLQKDLPALLRQYARS